MSKKSIRTGTIQDLKFDPQNANRGTARGQQALEESIQKFGLGRSVLVDKNGVILAGNKTVETSGALGIENVVFVPSDGKTIVAVVREDLDAETDPEARGIAIADNRTAELDLNWDAEQLLRDAVELVSLEPFFFQEDIDNLLEAAAIADIEEGREEEEDEGGAAEEAEDRLPPLATVQYNIIFNNDAEKEVWNSYLQWLKGEYPGYETIAERIVIDVAKRMEGTV